MVGYLCIYRYHHSIGATDSILGFKIQAPGHALVTIESRSLASHRERMGWKKGIALDLGLDAVDLGLDILASYDQYNTPHLTSIHHI